MKHKHMEACIHKDKWRLSGPAAEGAPWLPSALHIQQLRHSTTADRTISFFIQCWFRFQNRIKQCSSIWVETTKLVMTPEVTTNPASDWQVSARQTMSARQHLEGEISVRIPRQHLLSFLMG